MKYIDADKMKAEIKRQKHELELSIQSQGDYGQSCHIVAYDNILSLIDSLQQEQQEEVLIPKWCLENIENTLRIQHNINNDVKDGETCQDRNIKESLNCVRKLLNGEEITGRERLEPLMKQPEVDLEKEIEWEWVHREKQEVDLIECAEMDKETFVRFATHFYELGQKDAANKFDEIEYNRQWAQEESLGKTLDEAAEEYAYNNWEDNDYHTGASEGLHFDAIGHTAKCFKAGAKWMAEQGVTTDGIVCTDLHMIDVPDESLSDFSNSEEVIVQIRRR